MLDSFISFLSSRFSFFSFLGRQCIHLLSVSLDTVLFLTKDLARLSVRIAGVSKHLELWKEDGEIPTGEKLRGSAILQSSSEGRGRTN